MNWIELKSPVKVLAQSHSKYAEYLANKRVRMQEIHTSSDTTRSVGENLTVCFTKARSSHPPYLQPVIDTVTDGHYKPFQEVFKKPTTEEHRPSAKKASSKATLPFRASIQHVHNAGMMLQCDECACGV